MKVKCDWCGKIIDRPPSHVKRRKHHFCSRGCKDKWVSKNWVGVNHPRYTTQLVNCDYCGKKFGKLRNDVINTNHNFCSKMCFGKWERRRIDVECSQCGKMFHKTPAYIHDHNFCSKKCHVEWQKGKHVSPETEFGKGEQTGYWKGRHRSEKTRRKLSDAIKRGIKEGRYHFHFPIFFGENHPNWKGGHEPYYGPNWRMQRKKARARDNYTCQACDEKEDGHELDVHHITPFREFGLENYKKANQLDNLTTLCHSCHIKVERR